MGSINEAGTNIAVYRFNHGQEMVATGSEIAAWAGTTMSVVGFLVAAYKFYDDTFNKKGDSVNAKLDNIVLALGLDKLSEVVNDLTLQASVIDTAWRRLLTYKDTDSAPIRDEVKQRYGALTTSLAGLLHGKSYRLIPTVYPAAPWIDGRWALGKLYPADDFPYPENQYFQEYEQGESLKYPHGNALEWETAYPKSLSHKADRWDGLLCLPLVLYGVPVWRVLLTQLEPFFRLSGVYNSAIQDMSNQMGTDFAEQWMQSVVWIREMPSREELADSGTSFLGPESITVLGAEVKAPPIGFYFWSCGVLDPIIGVEKIYPRWWSDGWGSNEGPTPEMMTDEQRAQFKARRQLQRKTLDDENGFNAFMKITSTVDGLRRPPVASPSLRVYPKLLHLERTSAPQRASQPVTDPAGTDWPGDEVRSSVTVMAPIAVQPNPAPKIGARRAESDVVFGYEVSVTPWGGETLTADEWKWPLRQTAGQRSLHHNPAHPPADDPEILHVPYRVAHTFSSVQARTWQTVTDGAHRQRYHEAEGTVTFTMTVAVCDQAYNVPGDQDTGQGYPEVPLDPDQWDQSDPVKARAAYDIWSRQHGAIWISIEADDEANQGRSFEVMVHMKETARVDDQGQIQTDARRCKTYAQRMSIPVDICTITVQTGYFEGWLKAVLNAIQAIRQRKRAPGPGPNPVDELSQGRMVLERDPKALKAFTNELRRSTHLRSLTPQQALAQLDAAVERLAKTSGRTLTPAQLAQMAETAQLPNIVETAELRSTRLVQEQPTEQLPVGEVGLGSGASARRSPRRLSVGRLLARVTGFLTRLFTRSR